MTPPACDWTHSASIPGRIFLGGPIQHIQGSPGAMGAVRGAVEALLACFEAAGHVVSSAHVVEDFGQLTDGWDPDTIAARDLGWMREADVFVALLPATPSGELVRTDGTHVELGWASALRKPIVLVAEDPLTEVYSHLVRGLGAVATVELVEFRSAVERPEEVLEAVRRAAAASSAPCLVPGEAA